VYWPPPYGVIVTPYQQWVQQAINASYMVALLPVRRDLVFDEAAFWKWFPSVEGQEYGYERFLYSFLDTNPQQVRFNRMAVCLGVAFMKGFNRLDLKCLCLSPF
jgi:hypothetical protein